MSPHAVPQLGDYRSGLQPMRAKQLCSMEEVLSDLVISNVPGSKQLQKSPRDNEICCQLWFLSHLPLGFEELVYIVEI